MTRVTQYPRLGKDPEFCAAAGMLIGWIGVRVVLLKGGGGRDRDLFLR